MSDDEREKEIEFHIYGAKVLMDCLWQHMAAELGTVDEISEFIGVMLRDITEFHKTHEEVCEDCQKEDLRDSEASEPSLPGVVLPFPGNKDKDWGNN